MEQASKGAVISGIEPDSIAAQLDLSVGDQIISINDCLVTDLVDYRFLCADEFLEIQLKKINGEEWTLEIEKEIDENLGISFAEAVFDKVRSCQNKCQFCFVDQMPPNMRASLYVKDDDYRLSFLQGNFITLTNLKEPDIERIIRLNLSPLYVSIHALDEEIRKAALNNPQGAASLRILNQLIAAGIQIHTQIVLVPNLNDGEILERTVAKLAAMFPQILSLAVVPVGLTKYRHGLAEINPFSREEAGAVVDFIQQQQKHFLAKMGTRFIFAGDEFYFLANKPIPSFRDYEEFNQLENGVGLTRLFWHQTEKGLAGFLDKDKSYKKVRKYIIITGKSGKKVLQPIINKIMGLTRHMIELIVVENNWFGPLITVAGLLTGTDIVRELEKHDLQDKIVLIPAILLRQEGAVFLDNMTLADFKRFVKAPVLVVEISGEGLLTALTQGKEV